ncbi:MAG: xanthine dehydrogenase family protein subunit M [Acidobacteria bacterium]|nr:xanthine dehydrogenase family protein subunit M [Acidobacteriota bacterium]
MAAEATRLGAGAIESLRAYLPEYELKVPRDFHEALALLAREPGVWQPFAGGTDLMVLFEAGRLAHKKFVSIWHLPELRGIEETEEYVTLGALTTYAQVRASRALQREFPMLCQAASETGGLAIQNRGTLGGNIANASPAADSPPALIAYDAALELVSQSGARWIKHRDFHTGYKATVMRPDELLARIRLPRATAGFRQYYRKVGTRKAQAISKVCMAAMARLEEGRIAEARIALGSVAPTVLRSVKTESLLRGQALDARLIAAAKEEIAREVVPIDDIRSTASYRRAVSANLLEEFLLRLKG